MPIRSRIITSNSNYTLAVENKNMLRLWGNGMNEGAREIVRKFEGETFMWGMKLGKEQITYYLIPRKFEDVIKTELREYFSPAAMRKRMDALLGPNGPWE